MTHKCAGLRFAALNPPTLSELMPSQRSLRRDRAINLSLMNTVNVVFFLCFSHVSYVPGFDFSVIVISALNLPGLEL